jgi:hypothetical protein
VKVAIRAALAAGVLSAAAIGFLGTRELRPTNSSATESFDISFAAIPEPGALVSLIGGAAVLVGIQRFRRRS